jgi:hypothetical protein
MQSVQFVLGALSHTFNAFLCVHSTRTCEEEMKHDADCAVFTRAEAIVHVCVCVYIYIYIYIYILHAHVKKT